MILLQETSILNSNTIFFIFAISFLGFLFYKFRYGSIENKKIISIIPVILGIASFVLSNQLLDKERPNLLEQAKIFEKIGYFLVGFGIFLFTAVMFYYKDKNGSK